MVINRKCLRAIELSALFMSYEYDSDDDDDDDMLTSFAIIYSLKPIVLSQCFETDVLKRFHSAP